MAIGPFMCEGVTLPTPVWFQMPHSLNLEPLTSLLSPFSFPVDLGVKGTEVARVTRPVWWICLGGGTREVTVANGSLCHFQNQLKQRLLDKGFFLSLSSETEVIAADKLPDLECI